MTPLCCCVAMSLSLPQEGLQGSKGHKGHADVQGLAHCPLP